MGSQTNSAARPFVIRRAFKAPRETVFEAFTGLEGVKHWMGPKGVSVVKATCDFRSGGMLHYLMRMGDGKEMWGKWTYREIDIPKRVVAVVSFTDETGSQALPHPYAPDFPRESLSVTEFTEENGKTMLTVNWSPLNVTETQQRIFDAAHEGMTMGWTGSLDKLEAYLAEKK